MRLLFLLLLVSIGSLLRAQGRERTFKTDTGTVVVHYFTNGKVSTKAWMDKDDRWGRSWAYGQDGSVIAEFNTRRFAGHSSVHFEYHPNGAVSKVEFSSAPDAGIQWYRSTTTFDEHGHRTGFWEQGHDDLGTIPRPGRPSEQEQVTAIPDPIPEQRLFVNEVLIVNKTGSSALVRCTPTHPSPAFPAKDHLIQAGDSLSVGRYTVGEQFAPPAGQVELTIVEFDLQDAPKRTALLLMDQRDPHPEHRVHRATITGWTKAAGTGDPDERGNGPRRKWWKRRAPRSK